MHFTYSQPANEEHLEQGDILIKDNYLKDILQEVHPHYQKKSDYTHFMVLTQTCDLVLRKGKCNTRYITIAAIRPLATVLEREVARLQTNEIKKKANICTQRDYQILRNFLESLFNNNDPNYFYLENQPGYSLSEDSCAFLKLSISIKKDHYFKCLKARRLTLANEFKAKLGWKVGNIYSRIGTPDWVPTKLGKNEFNKKIKDTLKEHCAFKDDYELKEIFKLYKADNIDKYSSEELKREIDSIKVESIREKVVNRIVELLLQNKAINEDHKKKYMSLLKSDQKIKELLS